MNKKIFSLIIIAILAISCMPAVSAGTWHLDGDGRLIHYYRITDLATGWSTTKDVAAGDAHDVIIDDTHKLDPIQLQVTYGGVPHPNYHSVLLEVYDGSNVKVNGKLSYNWGCYYDSWLDFTYHNETVKVVGGYIWGA
jgi:hypothetical protein